MARSRHTKESLVRLFINAMGSFTHCIFLLQSTYEISYTSVLDLMWVLLFSLLIQCLIVFEVLVTVLIPRLIKFFCFCFIQHYLSISNITIIII